MLMKITVNFTGQWISHKGRTVHQCMAVIVTVKSIEDFVVGNSDSMSDIAAGQGFSQNQDIRQDKVCHKAVSGTAKSSGNLIKDQKHIILLYTVLWHVSGKKYHTSACRRHPAAAALR